MARSIELFIHRKIVILHETDSAFQAAKAMTTNRIGSVFVADRAGHITGVVTDRDLVSRVIGNSLNSRTRLREFMTKPVAHVSENASVEDAIDLMEKHGIRRIPVFREMKSDRQRCVGLVTLDDLIVADGIDAKKIRAIIKTQILHRYGHAPYTTKGTSGPASEEFVKRLGIILETSEKRAEAFARFVFSMIARRLNYSAAVQFILQLPYGFQEKLWDLRPGPDRLIIAQEVTQGVANRLLVPPEQARAAIRKLWTFLQQFGDKEQLRHTLLQLPTDLQDLIQNPESPIRHDFEEWTGA